MPSQTWKEAVAALKPSTEKVTKRQEKVAGQLGLRVPKNVPRLVAAVLLREALHDELLVGDFRKPSESQVDYLRDLAKAAGARPPKDVPTRDHADAWIAVMQARRATQALKELKLTAGDLVAAIDAPDTDVDEVASIDDTGRVFFKGGGGAGSRPHRLRVIARAHATGAVAEKSREHAANRRALRARRFGPPTRQRLAPLSPFKVGTGPSSANAEQLADTVDSAADERPVQRYLGEHPEVLASLVVSSYGKFVVPLPRLGSEYVPDFVVAVADSAGIHYTLVEIESPREKMALKNGQFAKKAREAIEQIENWREWLKDNLAYAQRPRESNGLGLPEIRPEARGLVVIGRRSEAPSYQNRVVRQRLEESSAIKVHSYDWLIEAVSPSRPARPMGALQSVATGLDLVEEIDLEGPDLYALLAGDS